MRNYLGELAGAAIVAAVVLVIGSDAEFFVKSLILSAAFYVAHVIQTGKLPKLKRPLSSLKSEGGKSYVRMAVLSTAAVNWFAGDLALALLPSLWFFGRWFLVLEDDVEELPTH